MSQTATGRTTPAGENTSNEEMARQVAGQTSSDRMAERIFRAEKDGARSDVEAAKAQKLRR